MNNKESVQKQLDLWLKGEPWHNSITDECCPDFSCCRPELLASEDERKKFCEAIEQDNNELKMGMLGMFLSTAISTYKPKTKVHITGFIPD